MIKMTTGVDTSKVTKYPKLMISKQSSSIVLFIRGGDGIKLSPVGEDAGTYRFDWNMSQFEDYNGSVTISNS